MTKLSMLFERVFLIKKISCIYEMQSKQNILFRGYLEDV